MTLSAQTTVPGAPAITASADPFVHLKYEGQRTFAELVALLDTTRLPEDMESAVQADPDDTPRPGAALYAHVLSRLQGGQIIALQDPREDDLANFVAGTIRQLCLSQVIYSRLPGARHLGGGVAISLYGLRARVSSNT